MRGQRREGPGARWDGVEGKGNLEGKVRWGGALARKRQGGDRAWRGGAWCGAGPEGGA